ncbi:MAG TPA: Lrp/AsnC family transcriptional regulator [Candidatus Aminicenantes bacterium]|mgnify:CR=1 FL=1|nr:Lrp/AsnC family transcriptional regulator [Acidobacteriota bacterium]HOI45424.1 Lrp/AsnC family transcriptional regulator [Candidatus Aminicenantes bacterium]
MISEIEKKIIRVMNRNARKSFREIAKEAGLSATAVMHAVKKMENAGVIKGYVPVLDPEYCGYPLNAVIAIRISQGKLLETQQKISEDPRVTAVFDVTGEWDSLIVGHFAGREDLNAFIKKLLSIRQVDRTVTHIVLNVVKDEKRVLL